ncbi:MAG: DUF87 domain-containing protein, partial [Candidatus Paceibacterota bacterium]
MEKFPAQSFKTPEEEIAFLRGELAREKVNDTEATVESFSENPIKKYAATPAGDLLPAERIMPERHAKMVALGLSEEPHDYQIGELLNLVTERGVKNALTVAEKASNPHLLDDFHRALVALIEKEQTVGNLSEKDPLWRPLHMTLFEISLPEASESQKEKTMTEVVSSMEQFYAGMASVAEEGKSRSWFTIELANSSRSSDFIFYVSVPTEFSRLLERQLNAILHDAQIIRRTDDYNIFNENGVASAAYAKLSKESLYPLRTYEDFDLDPLNVLIGSFAKIDRDGEGAAVQLLIGPRQDDYARKGAEVIESIKKGEKVSSALNEMERGIAGKVIKEAFGVFKTSEQAEKEKEQKVERAGQVNQEGLDDFRQKLKKPLMVASLRVVTSAATEAEAGAILNDICSSFNQLENAKGNRFDWEKPHGTRQATLLKDFSLRQWNDSEKMILNLAELTSVMHFPSTTLSKMAPQLRQIKAVDAPAPANLPDEGTLLGVNKFRGTEKEVRITVEDRLRHFYIIGQTGTGKTTLMKNMIAQDIADGHGVCFIDPHGTDINDVLGSVPESRRDDVIYFDPSRQDRVMGLNMLEFDPAHPEQKTFVVNELFSIFQKLYGGVPESMGPMFEQYFRNATLLVLEDPESGSTLLDITRVLADENFRREKLSKARNPVVTQFWNDIATKAGGEASLENIVPYITSKFDIFTANDFMRPIIGQQESAFNFRQLMDEKKILLVNLSKGRLGEINANLIGMIIVGKILMAALSRVDDIRGDYPPFFLHMDEFQNITTDSISAILSEARKYKLSLTMAHQFIAQLDEKIRDSVFGNVGSMAAFRVGPEDAEFLEKQFAPVFSAKDLMNIDNRQAYLRVLAGGTPQKPFNIATLPPKERNTEQTQALIEHSYQRYAKPRRKVEMEISS